MIKLKDILSEIVVKPAKTYEFRVGMTVREKSGDQELCKILAVKPNYKAIVDDPEYKNYDNLFYRSRIQHDEYFDEPFYLVKWLEHNAHAETSWWPEGDLEAVKQDEVDEIVVKATSNYEYNVGDKLQNKVGGVLLIKAKFKNAEEAMQANPKEKNFIENQASKYGRDGRWYGLVSAKAPRTKYLTIVPEKGLEHLTKL